MHGDEREGMKRERCMAISAARSPTLLLLSILFYASEGHSTTDPCSRSAITEAILHLHQLLVLVAASSINTAKAFNHSQLKSLMTTALSQFEAVVPILTTINSKRFLALSGAKKK